MFLISTDKNNWPVGLENVQYFFKEENNGIMFRVDGDFVFWEFDTEKERNQNYNLIIQKYGERLDEWK